MRGKRAPSRNDCRTLVHRREISPSSPFRHTPQTGWTEEPAITTTSSLSAVHILQLAFPPSTWT